MPQRASFRLPAFLGPVLAAALGLLTGVATVAPPLALASVTGAGRDAAASSSVGGFVITSTTTTAAATEVSYTVLFTPSSAGAAGQGAGTVTLTLPGATFNGASYTQGYVTFDDVTSGANGSVYAYQGTISDGGDTLIVTSPIDIAAGDLVQLTYYDVTNPAATGTPSASFSTSSDATAATQAFNVTAGNQAASGVTVSPSATAAGVSGVSYTVGLTASGTGGLVANQGTVTLALPASAAFAGEVQFDDESTGTSGTVTDSRGTTSDDGATLAVPVPVTVNAGDTLQLTYTDVTNPTAGGTQQATVSTSSDTQPVPASFTLAGGESVGITAFTASTTAAGATGASYSAQFTTSPAGGLVSGSGTITLTAPSGTVFGGPVTITDLTATAAAARAARNGGTAKSGTAKSGAAKASAVKISGVVEPEKAARRPRAATGGTVTDTVTVPINIAAGDEVSVVWAGVTNSPATGAEDLTLATSSDTVPVTQSLTLTAARAVSALGVTASTTAAGATQATYTVGFTASGTGGLAAGGGEIIIDGPAGTTFSAAADYSVKDVTSGQAVALSVVGVIGGDIGVKLGVQDAIAAGDMVVVTAYGVTNPSAAGAGNLTVSTTSDTVAATAGITLTAGNQPVTAVATALTTTAAGASGVSYQVTFTASGTGALSAGYGTVVLSLPSGSAFSLSTEANVEVRDLTTGASGWQDTWDETEASDTELIVPVPVAIAAGDTVQVTFTGVTSAPAAGQKSATFFTSSDTKPVTASFTLTAGSQPVATLSSPVLTSAAADASGVDYQLTFTASATGGLASDDGTISLSLAPGTTIGLAGAEVDDLTSGQQASTTEVTEDNGSPSDATVTVPFTIAAGDKVTVTLPGAQNAATAGTYAATVSTSSDTKPVTASYTLAQPAAVNAPGVTVSNPTAGQAATYGVTFTASADGTLNAGEGQITLAAPAGTVFDGSAGYTGQDITSGKSLALTVAGTSDDGATIALTSGQQVSAGDQVAITAPGVTNAATTGAVALDISTSSDRVAAAAGYTLGDSAPQFTAASPPLSIAPGSSQGYTFTATGWPLPAYSLAGAPSWLTINPATGQLSGTAPASGGTFTFSVTAANSVGTATEGPYTVTVESTATISGSVVDSSGDPVDDVEVNACDTAGDSCESATTDETGAYSITAVAGSVVVLTAYPPQGSGAQASTGDITVPAAGLAGQVITVQDTTGIPGTLKVNGSASPTVFWESPATATMTGCATGIGAVSVVGQNTQTGKFNSTVIPLAESPVGSGDYTGTIPPEAPVHGPVQIEGSVSCPDLGSLYPALGPASGGTQVALTGSGFTSVTAVDFGGTAAQGYSVLSDDTIDATAPPGAGTVAVTVHDGATVTTVGQYTYQAVTSITPKSGPAAGDTWVIIDGTGLANATGVSFGDTSVEFAQLSPTEVEALSPAGSGTQDITVTTLFGGTTPATAADQFTYTGASAAASKQARQLRELKAQASAALDSPVAKRLLKAIIAQGVALAADQPATERSVTSSAASGDPAAVNPASGLGAAQEVAKVLWSEGPVVQSGFGNLKTYVNAILAVQHPSCDTTHEELTALVQQLIKPFVDAWMKVVTADIEFIATPLVEAALAFPVLAIIVILVAAVAPLVVSYYTDQFLDLVISAGVDALLGECPKKPGENVPPPKAPPFPPPPQSFTPTGFVDPSGTVLDTNGNTVSGATVTIERSYTPYGAYLPVQPSDPGISPAVNPQVTGANGVFHWDVSAGYYEIQAVKSGCTTTTIGPYPVPPPQVGLTITMTCTGEAKPPAPTVAGLSAGFGPPGGGTVLTVTGTNFTPASKVAFGATAAANVTYLSPQALSVTSPKGSGTVDVRVTTAGGTSAKGSADRFFFGSAPTVTDISPSSGPASGGTTVTITGTSLTGAASVSFGGVAAAKVTVKSATRIIAVTGKGTAGPAGVQVISPAGESNEGTFGYLAPVVAYVATGTGIVPVAEGASKAASTVKVAGRPAGLAATPDGDTLVVSGSKGVTEISTDSGQAGGDIPAGKAPRAVAVTPDGATAYVANYGSGSVTPVTVATGLAGKAITVGSDPVAVAVTPDGATAYVVNYGSGTVTPVTVATGKAGAAIRVGSHPVAVAITPDGKTAYVVNEGSGTVIPVTVATGKAGKAIAVGSDPVAVALTPNGATAYVVNEGSATVTPVTVATGKAGKAIAVGKAPVAVAITPDGKTAYVVGEGSATVTPVTVATGKAGKAIAVGKAPVAIAVTPDGKILYVLNHGSATVTPVTVVTGKAGKAIAVGADPAVVVITP